MKISHHTVSLSLVICLFAVVSFQFSSFARASAGDCPAIPAFDVQAGSASNQNEAWQGFAPPYSARALAQSFGDVHLGVGYLRVTNSDGLLGTLYYEWPMHLQLPYWMTPEASAFGGWIFRGQIYAEDVGTIALSGAGTIETDYEQSSMIVHAKRGDWLRVRVSSEEKYVWLHACHLGHGEAILQFEPWETFIRQHGDWLHFRAEVMHNLRTDASAESGRVALIGLDHKLKLLDMRGDWMRVHVEQPDTTCSDGARTSSVIHHSGWIKWRDDSKGPWVWVYTRGC